MKSQPSIMNPILGSEPTDFDRRVARWELPTCPPQAEGAAYNNIHGTRRWFTWRERGSGRRILARSSARSKGLGR